MNAEKKKMDEWRDATLDEMRRWPTVSMLKKHFADARITRDQGKSPDESASAIYMKYQVKDKEALGIQGVGGGDLMFRRESQRLTALEKRVTELERTLVETREYLVETRAFLIQHLKEEF